MTAPAPRDHGGGLDAAIAQWGGTRADWIDLSTGINAQPYALPAFEPEDWTALPDQAAEACLLSAARQFWGAPDSADILAAPGASALIAAIPRLVEQGRVDIPGRTYNEHAAAFRACGWEVSAEAATARVRVHPNNPDGALMEEGLSGDLLVIDESFCDVMPEASQIKLAGEPGVITLKSFGKFWGLAGLRLGFAIAAPELIAPLKETLGPWPVSGPALRVGAQALEDHRWADQTRTRLKQDAARLDDLIPWPKIGGTDLFRLYETGDAAAAQDKLARAHIWSRIFPYSTSWLRLGIPGTETEWDRLEEALK